MLSNFEAAVEAALIRKEISKREIVDEKKSSQRGSNFELKNSMQNVLNDNVIVCRPKLLYI